MPPWPFRNYKKKKKKENNGKNARSSPGTERLAKPPNLQWGQETGQLQGL